MTTFLTNEKEIGNEMFLKTTKDTYKVYLQYLRILGSIFVIAIHFCAKFFSSFNYSTYQWLTSTFYNCLSRTAVPIFFFISGALVLDENKTYSFKKLFNKIFRFFIITIFWIFVYFISDYILYKQTPSFAEYKYHLWFMFDYIILLILTPVLKLICKKENKVIVKYLLSVFVIGYVLISLLETFNYIDSDFIIVKLIKQGIYLISQFKITQLANCFILAISGWYISSFDMTKYKKPALFFLLINFAAIFGVLLLCMKKNNTLAFDYFSGCYNIFTYFTTLSLFIVFKYSKLTNRDNKYVKFISKNTFAIYLLHVLIIDLIFYFIGNWIYSICSTAMALIYIPIIIILIFIITFFCSLIFLLLPPKIRKYLC